MVGRVALATTVNQQNRMPFQRSPMPSPGVTLDEYFAMSRSRRADLTDCEVLRIANLGAAKYAEGKPEDPWAASLRTAWAKVKDACAALIGRRRAK